MTVSKEKSTDEIVDSWIEEVLVFDWDLFLAKYGDLPNSRQHDWRSFLGRLRVNEIKKDEERIVEYFASILPYFGHSYRVQRAGDDKKSGAISYFIYPFREYFLEKSPFLKKDQTLEFLNKFEQQLEKSSDARLLLQLTINEVKKSFKPGSSRELGQKVQDLADKFADCCYDDNLRSNFKKLAWIYSGNDPELYVPFHPIQPWAKKILSDVSKMPKSQREQWLRVLAHCGTAKSGKPNKKWEKLANKLFEDIGPKNFEEQVTTWFNNVPDDPFMQSAGLGPNYSEDYPLSGSYPPQENRFTIRGLIWFGMFSRDSDFIKTIRDFAQTNSAWMGGMGINACITAIARSPGIHSVAHLAVMRVKQRDKGIQKVIDRELRIAAEKAGVTPDELEEMSTPDYDLTDVGERLEPIGDYTAKLVLDHNNKPVITWLKPDGKEQKSIPVKVRENWGQELKQLKADAKDIQKIIPAIKQRIENTYLAQKVWDYDIWAERYLNHPLVGTVTRRLIWQIGDGKNWSEACIYFEGSLVNRQGQEMNGLKAGQIRLWHPLYSPLEDVLGWRTTLQELQIKQPFKQAHREIYLLTDAEKNTRAYSNRFAAHIVKQHQFKALGDTRGWKGTLKICADMEVNEMAREIPAYGLRAEFWTETLGDYDDCTDAGAYIYLSTDQVRFHPLEAGATVAHAWGGRGRWGEDNHEGIPLEEIPKLPFSEIMRDADLFVGVASVGNDPTWVDGETSRELRERHTDYWSNYSFGDLGESAKIRKELLEGLIPRLKIANKCRIEGRFLYVTGDIRTYKIHLGSGNILMEPNDEYLCIVRGRNTKSAEKLFLPFEGDGVLSTILSKAFLLADDKKITDSTIVSQINRK